MKNEEASTKKASSQDVVEVEKFNGMSDEKSSLVETIVMNEDSVSDEALSLQVVNEEIIAMDSVVIEKITIEDNVSTPGDKRKYLDETEIEVSASQKRARMTCSSEKGAHDHSYCIESPRRVRRQVDDLVDKLENLQKRLNTSQKKTRRRNKKVSTLTAVVSELREKNLINSDCATILESTFSGVPKELMKRLVTQKKKKNLGAYPPELRSFALTLKFYSTKAYNYVRKSFDLGLPHVDVIRSWYSSINGVDLGTGINDDSLPEATDALVFMAVSVNSGWKVPCGYFLVNGLTGEQKANLTKECITKLHEVGVKVVSFTCDGPTSHQAMLKLLGAQLSPDNLQAYFQHPCDPKAKVYIFPDACHMIKLVRNTMSDWKVLKDKDGNAIKWQFVEELHKLQESEGLHLANKLRSAHIKWKPQKMKVNLAAQALSSSVADALEYCEGKLKLPQFQGCGPTVQCICVFDHIFDVLNSRNPLTYKMSHDHLELFFSAVRACGGRNNNPTTRQFVAAYKQLLMRHNIEGGHGNCTPQDDTEILNSVQDQHEINSVPTGISDVAIARRYDLELRQPAADDHDYCDVSNAMELSEYKEAAISYIAGYVVKMVEKKIHCPQCLAALITSKENIPDLFVTWKTNGGLKLPSLGLIKICEETEKCVMRMLNVNGGGLPHSAGLSSAIATTVLSVCVESNVFSELDQHMFDSTPGNNHVFKLIKCCCQSYVTIRMHHLSKTRNAGMHDKVDVNSFRSLCYSNTSSFQPGHNCAFEVIARTY